MIESLWPAQINAIIEAPFLRLVTRLDSSSSYLSELNKGIAPNPTNNVFSDIWGEYERVILDGFLERGAISLAQHDKSLCDLIEKMGEHDEN